MMPRIHLVLLLISTNAIAQTSGTPTPDFNSRFRAQVEKSTESKSVKKAFAEGVAKFSAKRKNPNGYDHADFALKSKDEAHELLKLVQECPGTPAASQEAMRMFLSSDLDRDHPDPD